jgi:hypothetical protein
MIVNRRRPASSTLPVDAWARRCVKVALGLAMTKRLALAAVTALAALTLPGMGHAAEPGSAPRRPAADVLAAGWPAAGWPAPGSPAAGSPAAGSPAADSYTAGLNAGGLAAAEPGADKAVAWHAAVHTELARVYFQGGAIDLAEDESNQALRIDAGSRDAAHLLALVALRRGEFDLAEAFFDRALAAQAAVFQGRVDPVLAANYANFRCERMGECVSGESGKAPKATRVEIGQLHAQSIAIDNSAASDPIGKPLNDGRTGQSQQATGGTMDRRTRQEYSSEELRDE